MIIIEEIILLLGVSAWQHAAAAFATRMAPETGQAHSRHIWLDYCVQRVATIMARERRGGGKEQPVEPGETGHYRRNCGLHRLQTRTDMICIYMRTQLRV